MCASLRGALARFLGTLQAVWDRLMDAMNGAVDGNMQMIDSSSVRVRPHAAGAEKGDRIVTWVVPGAEQLCGMRKRSSLDCLFSEHVIAGLFERGRQPHGGARSVVMAGATVGIG